VLFKRRVLDGLADGTIDLAFRRWAKPRVREGSRLRTAVGVVEVDTVEEVGVTDITDKESRRAGYSSRSELLADMATQRDGQVYRIVLHVAGPDPRVALRDRKGLTGDELAEIEQRLGRLDAASRHGAWTMTVLQLIRDRPAVRAGDLAPELGQETQPFKRDVRKLKELGLTESLEVGYRLSPRGGAVLERTKRSAPRAR
jgi:hypothetical protein